MRRSGENNKILRVQSVKMKKIKVLIADDHKIIRVGLRGILAGEADIEVVGEAECGDDVFTVLKEQEADVVLMDIDMGASSGVDATAELKARYPEIKVLTLTQHEEQDLIINMLEAGASGYLLKNCGREELITAIHAVLRGDSYFSQTVSATLLRALTTRKNHVARDQNDLTERELEVLTLIAQEYTNPEIAEKLFISVRTVDTHRRNLMEKLNAKNTAALVKYAISKHLA
jgi:DNA-binding NarL/FixJ family response regulator